MIDKIKSQLTTSYMMFIFELHDPVELDRKDLEARMRCQVDEIFETQRKGDLAKKRLDKDFPKALSLYFQKYQTSDGINVQALSKAVEKNNRTMQRHLGKDKMVHLSLIVNLMRQLDERPRVKRGLLSEHAA